jgi:hypothetical protein
MFLRSFPWGDRTVCFGEVFRSTHETSSLKGGDGSAETGAAFPKRCL